MEIFSNGYYKINRISLSICGVWPEQKWVEAYAAQAVMLAPLLTLMIPEGVYFYQYAVKGSIMNDAILCLPSVLSMVGAIIKMQTISQNQDTFQIAIDEMRKDWRFLDNTPAGDLMHKYAARGRVCTLFYMGVMFSALILFLGFPMTPIFMDYISPLNETRTRPPLFETEYGIENPDDYFFLITMHGYYAAITLVTILWTVDSFVMIMVQHCCGLFEIVGFTLQRLNIECDVSLDRNQQNIMYHAISIHKRAISFADFIASSLTSMYCYIIILNMAAISITGVGAIFQMDNTDQAIRFAVFGIGQIAHLFFNSIPGQQLTDHSSRVFDTIYSAEWHILPVRLRKLIGMMLVRSAKPNNLSAGGFYQMNMENFSQVMQTSMSYMTVLMSMR